MSRPRYCDTCDRRTAPALDPGPPTCSRCTEPYTPGATAGAGEPEVWEMKVEGRLLELLDRLSLARDDRAPDALGPLGHRPGIVRGALALGLASLARAELEELPADLERAIRETFAHGARIHPGDEGAPPTPDPAAPPWLPGLAEDCERWLDGQCPAPMTCEQDGCYLHELRTYPPGLRRPGRVGILPAEVAALEEIRADLAAIGVDLSGSPAFALVPDDDDDGADDASDCDDGRGEDCDGDSDGRAEDYSDDYTPLRAQDCRRWQLQECASPARCELYACRLHELHHFPDAPFIPPGPEPSETDDCDDAPHPDA